MSKWASAPSETSSVGAEEITVNLGSWIRPLKEDTSLSSCSGMRVRAAVVVVVVFVCLQTHSQIIESTKHILLTVLAELLL